MHDPWSQQKMAQMMKKWILYALYVVLAVLGFLYFLFPADSLKRFLEGTAGQAGPGYFLSIEEVRPSLLLGLRLQNSRIFSREDPERPIFQSRECFIRPEVWSFLRGRSKYVFQGRAHEGAFKGEIHFGGSNRGSPIDLTLTLNDIPLEKTYVATLEDVGITGLLEGSLTFRGRLENPIKGTGDAVFKLSEGEVTLSRPFGGLKSLHYGAASIQLALEAQKLTITRVDFDGREAGGQLSGFLRLKDPLPRSNLYLKGSLRPSEGLTATSAGGEPQPVFLRELLRTGSFSFRIVGTLGDPRITFVER